MPPDMNELLYEGGFSCKV